jgi:hypothetical protein
MKEFLISSAIWFLVVLPMVILSFFVVAILLFTPWNGTTTWFGNFKYGRGTTHYKAPTSGNRFKEWLFLCVRNPVSNFGKKVISVKDAPWVWLKNPQVLGPIYWKYGWKDAVPENDNLRTFVYRPWIMK